MVTGHTIQLDKLWRVGSQLTAGGFGEVFFAESETGEAAVVKLIPKAPGAERELLFENVTGVANVIPIWDSGEANGQWALVMPRAEKSLRDLLNESKSPLAVDEVIAILRDIASALDSLATKVVHRDLKPENVLLYQGAWCLADFGIARYAEAATASETRKFSMTPEYAAPEQWRSEHATTATDVYAFWVMAYELLSGARLFRGTNSELRDQHLHANPKPLQGISLSLANLIAECLFKAPESRPTAANIVARLQRASVPMSEAMRRLQNANQQAAVQKASAEAARSAEQTAADRRAQLFTAGLASYERLGIALAESVAEAAPLSVQRDPPDFPFRLNHAALTMSQPQSVQPPFDSPIEVIAHAEIRVRKPRDRFGYAGRSHSLWYCDAQVKGAFRWYETAFWSSGFHQQRPEINPFALSPGAAEQEFTPVLGALAFARALTPVDQGEEEGFIERWITWFAAAADGSLQMPAGMPESQAQGSWRHS